jgi:hypothetical protein
MIERTGWKIIIHNATASSPYQSLLSLPVFPARAVIGPEYVLELLFGVWIEQMCIFHRVEVVLFIFAETAGIFQIPV